MYILCNIFKESFNTNSPFLSQNRKDFLQWERFLNIEPSQELESKLSDIVNLVIGFSFDGKYDYSAVRVCFDNIVRNIPYSTFRNMSDIINDYKNRYIKLLEDNHYVNLFIETIKKIYSPAYDGKLGNLNREQINYNHGSSAHVGIFGSSITIGVPSRIGEDDIPFIQIHDAYAFEQDLENFITEIKNSFSAYNVYAIDNFRESYTDDEMAKILFEAIILNATSYELSNASRYFKKYINYLKDDTMPSLTNLTYLGKEFDDEVYFKVKRSDIEYETPWYFAFMLRNHRFELPNVRLAIIDKENGEKMANIVAVQSSQLTRSNSEVSDMIKKKTPKTSTFRFYNPDHFISIVLAFGILNGLGIREIDIQDFMPIRFRKTVLDCHMNEKEATDYIKRVYDKNIACYYKMMLLTKDIFTENYPGSGSNLHLKTNDVVEFKDDFLNNLYTMGYNYGKSLSIDSIER